MHDVPCISYMALYVISTQIINSNSRSQAHSNHWKLNTGSGKVEPVSSVSVTEDGSNESDSEANSNSSSNSDYSSSSKPKPNYDDDIILPSRNRKNNQNDKIMHIISNKVPSPDGWLVKSPRDRDDDFIDFSGPNFIDFSTETNSVKPESAEDGNRGKIKKKTKPLSCGKKVNYTIYDDLRGILERLLHPHLPEPDVAMVFKSSGKSSEVDMHELEHRLRKARRDIEKSKSKPTHQSAQVYNLIGNFWRIKGNTHVAIECFRKSLSISPEDPDTLLNLARVLFNLQYLDDAIFLARRSLHLQAPGENSWLQHFTLGEILKSSGHSAEATMHFNQALELNPEFQPCRAALRELQPSSSPSVGQLTVCIILCLVVATLAALLTQMDDTRSDPAVDGRGPQPRHFNRALAMRTMKMGITRATQRGRVGA